MSFDPGPFRSVIIAVLTYYGLHSRAAVNLLLGTAAQESDLGTHVRQLGGGPALGVFQMEPSTFGWLRDKFASRIPGIAERDEDDLVKDLMLAILFARLRYRVVPSPLPPHDDIEALGRYWKQHYNTPAGAGTVEQFVAHFKKYIGG